MTQKKFQESRRKDSVKNTGTPRKLSEDLARKTPNKSPEELRESQRALRKSSKIHLNNAEETKQK
ncbi:4715_t:CDS:2 [Cetraspora pellucida]|uniref:4715_t:CDS:1 n=1 Tax=Cetraspora pellucida TaxID=1433469 RepID=A0A9N8VK33_9GLOM|nr:4715_t:CDS:2 [Cetraspora pellucida]